MHLKGFYPLGLIILPWISFCTGQYYVIHKKRIAKELIIQTLSYQTVTSCQMLCSNHGKCTTAGLGTHPRRATKMRCYLINLNITKCKENDDDKLIFVLSTEERLATENKESLAKSKLYSCTSDQVLKAYESLGCFTDKFDRAISGAIKLFQKELINKCYLRAKKEGNMFFAVENGQECFTSHDAGETYGKHGATTGCENGEGGSWKMDVYRLTGVLAYESLGCFEDDFDRAISGAIKAFQEELINKCYLRAKKEGNMFFGVENGKECFTSPDAGETYDKHGRTTGCDEGEGGPWKMDVYRLTGALGD